MSSEQDVFCVFEGGGAKGVAHVGFLTALDDHHNYNVRGYAGTSAGAVVAALAAVGWKGHELFDEASGERKSLAMEYLNKEHNEKISSLADFIEPREWRLINLFRKPLSNANAISGQQSVRDAGETARLWLVSFLALMIVLLLLSVVMMFWGKMFGWVFLGIISFLFSAPACLFLGYFSAKYSGFASMQRPEDLFEKLLQMKIPDPPSGKVTFQDVENATGHRLKIIASDLENGNIKLFSVETTADVSVAQAVTASACIPLIFKPVVINIDGEPRQFCDGGIVSNLPAWAFDSERITDANCLTVTCEVSPPRPESISRRDLKGLRLFTRVAITSVFGSAGLNTRGMLRHIRLSAWAGFNLLDFDLVDEQVDLIQTSREQADIKMDYENLHRVSIDGMFGELNHFAKNAGLLNGSLRVSYARFVQLVDGPPAGFHLWNCRGFEGCADAGITLPVKDSLLGSALQTEEISLYDLEDEDTKAWYFGVGNGALEGRVAKDRKWVVIVPIPEKKRTGRVSVAVCVDGKEKPNMSLDTLSSEIGAIVRKFA